MNNPKYLVVATVILCSLGPLLTRLISIQSQLLSLVILFTFTFCFFLITSGIHYKSKFANKVKKLNFKYFLFGLFGYFFYYLGLVQSFHLFNSASEPAILNYTFPLFTVLFTDIFVRKKLSNTNEKIRLIEYFGVFIGFLAVVDLATKGDITTMHVDNIPAIVWGLSAGISYALFSVYSTSVTKENQDIFLLASIFSSLLMAIIIAAPDFSALQAISLQTYIANAILAIIINGFGYLAWTRANRIAKIENISISTVASLILIIPFLGLLIVALVLHETELLQPYFLVSLFGIVVSSLLCQKSADIFSFVHRLQNNFNL